MGSQHTAVPPILHGGRELAPEGRSTELGKNALADRVRLVAGCFALCVYAAIGCYDACGGKVPALSKHTLATVGSIILAGLLETADEGAGPT